mmetsp:Transcript_15877/g.31852  ORF Transcript_15877/g.31852 Transcript_15877/m.31852 type:complete len:87 (-) Transcript_15877:183-443(-)
MFQHKRDLLRHSLIDIRDFEKFLRGVVIVVVSPSLWPTRGSATHSSSPRSKPTYEQIADAVPDSRRRSILELYRLNDHPGPFNRIS